MGWKISYMHVSIGQKSILDLMAFIRLQGSKPLSHKEFSQYKQKVNPFSDLNVEFLMDGPQ